MRIPIRCWNCICKRRDPLELVKDLHVAICIAQSNMQRCMSRFAASGLVLVSDAATTATLLQRCSFTGIAGLVAAGGPVTSSTASRSDTIPQRSRAPWPSAAAALQTPCTDALPQTEMPSQSFAAAARHLRRLSGPCGRLAALPSPCGSIDQGAAVSRAFATEAPQTQAERFDIIQQESGAVRIEG